LPDTKPIEPYVGLLSLIVLQPDALSLVKKISTSNFPPISAIKNGRFVPAASNRSASAPGVARIFDASALKVNTPDRNGHVPLLTELPTFNQLRYWRIPVNMGAILVALRERVGERTYASEEITCTQNIFRVLGLQRSYDLISIPALADPQGGPLGDNEEQEYGDNSESGTDVPVSSGDRGQSLGKRKHRQGSISDDR
jgi:hypothetical protein